MKHTGRLKLAMGAVLALGFAASTPAFAKSWYPYHAVQVIPPMAANGQHKEVSYVPLKKAEKPWKICVSFPHMKDPYWLGVDYGVVEEAKALGVKMNLVQAGGYTHLSTQISQIEDCVAGGAQAVVIGAISYTGLNNLVAQITKKGIPVIDLVNGMSSPDISAHSLVSFYTMGHEAGAYLAKLHPAGTKQATVGWFPGPAGAGWVTAANEGFMAAVKGSALKVLPPKYGDTGQATQLQLVEDELQADPSISIVAGTAVTAQAAQGLIRSQGLEKKVKLVAFYLTPGVYEGIQRGTILAAPADSMVIQGRIAIDQAVRILEHKPYMKDVGPKIVMIDKSTIGKIDRANILPPKTFKPVFNVN